MGFLLFSISSFLASELGLAAATPIHTTANFHRDRADGLVQWNSNAGLFSVIADIGAYHVQPSCQILVWLSGKGPV